MTTYQLRDAPQNSELLFHGDIEEPLDIICFGEIVITLNIIDGKRWLAIKDIIDTEGKRCICHQLPDPPRKTFWLRRNGPLANDPFAFFVITWLRRFRRDFLWLP